MEQITDRDSNIYGQCPTTSSAENNFPSTTRDNHSSSPSLSRGLKRKQSRSGEVDESYSTVSEDLVNRLQKECEKKDSQLEIYSGYIDMLKSNCATNETLISQLRSEAILKDRRLSAFSEQSNLSTVNELQEECSNKNTQLIEMKREVEQLKAEIAKKDTQLKANSDTIRELQTQPSSNKDSKLIEMEGEIKQLKTKIAMQANQLKANQTEISKLEKTSVETKYQLKQKTTIISSLQTSCNDKDAQLAEKTSLITRLQARRSNKENEAQPIPEILKNLEDDVNSHFDALFGCAEKCVQQKQYVKANVHHKEAIKFEQATQNRSDKLAMLFVEQSFCYGELKSYQQEIDAASLAFQHDPTCKEALYNRAFAHFNLKQYSKADQDLKTFLKLDSTDLDAQKLMEKVQKCLNEAK